MAHEERATVTRKDIIDNLKGIFLPIVTPFNRRGGIDEGRFRENLRRYVETGLAGILVAGSTGEAPYLAERERLRLVQLAREVVRPPLLLIAGTGLESTRATIFLSREAIARTRRQLVSAVSGRDSVSHSARTSSIAVRTRCRPR